jgi:hypothetical protein
MSSTSDWGASRRTARLRAEYPWFLGQWRFQAIVHDLGVDIVEDGAEEREEYRGAPDFAVFISMYFPQGDLPQVLARLKRFNRKRTQLARVAGEQRPHES